MTGNWKLFPRTIENDGNLPFGIDIQIYLARTFVQIHVLYNVTFLRSPSSKLERQTLQDPLKRSLGFPWLRNDLPTSH
jgi:hypothetical protein